MGTVTCVNASEPVEDAGKLLRQIAKLDGMTFKAEGMLKRSWIVFDEDNPSYVVQIGNFKYSAKLDDGRGTSKRAKNCPKESMMAINSKIGCPISFEAEYDIESSSGGVNIKLVVWGVDFK